MCSIEAELCGPKLLSSPELSNGGSSEVILYCPECAARLRLIGGNVPDKLQDRSLEKGHRATLPDWLPVSDAGTNALPVAPSCEPTEPTEERVGSAPLLVADSFDVNIDLAAIDEQDEPTRVINSSALLLPLAETVEQAEQVSDGPSPATLVAGGVEPSLTSSMEPLVVVCHDESENATQRVEANPSVSTPKRETELASRPNVSDAPLTRELTPIAEPGLRRKSGGRYFGIALGAALVSVVAIQGFRVYRSEPSDKQSNSVAVATKPIENAIVPVPSVMNVVTPNVASAQPIASGQVSSGAVRTVSTEKDVKPLKLPKEIRQPTAAIEVETADEEVPSREVVAKTEQLAFDADAAASALDDAASRASSCRQAADPSGVAVVTVTFAPSGRVTTATIAGPPFVGTTTGSCIAATMRSAKIPEYSGQFKTVKKTVTVH
jgi:hypothetical protein